MEIVPFIGDKELSASRVVVQVSPDDRKRVQALVARTKNIQAVVGEAGFATAKKMAGEAKAMLDEMAAAKKVAKQPFSAVIAAIDALVAEVGSPVDNEHKRVLGLLNTYVADLERRVKEEEAKKAEALRIQNEAHQAKLREAAEKLAIAELEARQAQDEAARLRAQQEAAQRQQALQEARLDQEMDAAIALIGADKPKKGLVTAGRVDHPWKFEVTDIGATIKAGRMRLLKWTLDIRACQDDIRAQLYADPETTPWLPGIKCWQEISVSVKAQARTN
jgi:hypothetical protein